MPCVFVKMPRARKLPLNNLFHPSHRKDPLGIAPLQPSEFILKCKARHGYLLGSSASDLSSYRMKLYFSLLATKTMKIEVGARSKGRSKRRLECGVGRLVDGQNFPKECGEFARFLKDTDICFNSSASLLTGILRNNGR